MGKTASPAPAGSADMPKTRQSESMMANMTWALGSQTPSSLKKRSKRSRKAEESPLSHRVLTITNADRHVFASSPIKKVPLPSPSPDRNTSKSSPLKDARSELRKKVMFTKDLIYDATLPHVPTPRKPILKNAANIMSSPPQMQELTSPKTHKGVAPDMPQFWSPGNIPHLSQPGISGDIHGFKTLFTGGLNVLKRDDCNRQFEIYATFNLLFKDLTDKRASIVATYLSELLPILQNDVVKIESTIFDEQTPDPFLTRADVQIIKLCTVILSNTKIHTHIFKLNVKMKEFVSWAITHSCIVITRSDTSKSLLSANLQLIKEQKLHTLVLPGIQEYMLSSVMKMKYIQSASLIGEKLNTIKALIINCSPMMEKNIKVWLSFLFNCLCDFSSPLYMKTISVASIVLLEVAKIFINSKVVMFEMRAAMSASIMKTLNIQPESQLSFVSSPLDLSQSTLTYVIMRLTELLEQGQAKLALDIWLGFSVLLLGDPAFLKFNLSSDSLWYRIIHRCLISPNKESKELALKAWRVFVYSLANALENLPRDNFNDFMSLMLSVYYFDEKLLSLKEFVSPMTNLFSQVCYALLNSVKLRDMNSTITHCLVSVLKRFLDAKSPELTNYTSKILAHMLSAQLSSKDYTLFLVKVMSSDPFDMREIRPLPSMCVFKCHSVLFELFKERIWPKEDIQYRVKASILSSLTTKLKGALTLDIGHASFSRLCSLIDNDYRSFFPMYVKTLSEASDQDSTVEHVNKYIILLKTTFGPLCTARQTDKKEITYLKKNIYVSIIKETLKYPCKITEVLKYLLSHIKAYRLPFFEDLTSSLNDKNINQYITNNLESMIFEKPFTNADALALSHTVGRIPKTDMLFKSYFIAISKTAMPGIYVSELSLKTWTYQDIIILWSYVSRNFPSVEPTVIEAVSSQLQEKDVVYAKGMLEHIVSEVPPDVLPRFKEHVLFHAIDYHGVYNDDDHDNLFNLFKLYIDGVGNVTEGERDGILQHGIGLSLSLLRISDSETSLLVRVSKVLDYIAKYIDSSFACESREVDDSITLTRKSLATFESEKRNLSYVLPVECLEVFGWSVPLDRDVTKIVHVNSNGLNHTLPTGLSPDEDLRLSLPTQESSTGLKDTLPIISVHEDSHVFTSEQEDNSSSSVLDALVPSTAELQDHVNPPPESSDLSSSSFKDTLEIEPTKTVETVDVDAQKSVSQEPSNLDNPEMKTKAEVQVFSSDKSANTGQEIFGRKSTQLIENGVSSVSKIVLIVPKNQKNNIDESSLGPTQVIEEPDVETSPEINKSASVELTERPLPTIAEGTAAILVVEEAMAVFEDAFTEVDFEDEIVEDEITREEQEEAIEEDSYSKRNTSAQSPVDHHINSSPMKEQQREIGKQSTTSGEDPGDSDCELIEIDNEEFKKSFSPKRKMKPTEFTQQKRQHTEQQEQEESFISSVVSYSSPTPKPRQSTPNPDGLPIVSSLTAITRSPIPVPLLDPFIDAPAKAPSMNISSATCTFDIISGFFDGITDEQVASLDDREVFEIENRLLGLMMKMRSHR